MTQSVGSRQLPLGERIRIQRARVDAFEALAGANRGGLAWDIGLSETLKNLGDLEYETGDMEATGRTRDRALEVARNLTGRTGDWRMRVAVAIIHRGDVRKEVGEALDAERIYLEAHALVVEDAASGEPDALAAEVFSYVRLTDIANLLGDEATVARHAQESWDDASRLVATSPGSSVASRALYYAATYQAMVAGLDKDVERRRRYEAEKVRAATIAERREPRSWEARRLSERAIPPTADRETLELVLRSAEARRDEVPENVVHTFDVIDATLALVEAAVSAGDLDGGLRRLDDALELSRRLARERPTHPDVAHREAAVREFRFRVLEALGRFDEARQELRASAQAFVQGAKRVPTASTLTRAAEQILGLPNRDVTDRSEALGLALQAFERSQGRSTVALRSVVAARAELGQRRDAARDLRRLLQLLPAYDSPRKRALQEMLRGLETEPPPSGGDERGQPEGK